MIRRNVASQVIVLPFLGLAADASAVTSGASLTVIKDGSSAASAGTLTHVSGGVWQYTLTQGETDAAIVGLILSATSAIPVVLNLVTTGMDTALATQPVNLTQIGGDTQSLTDFKDLVDTGYDPAEHTIAAELDSASLIRFVTEDTGETTAADGSVAKLSQGGGGGDATLAKQEEILAALQGVEAIQVASPNVQGNLVLTQGDSYDGIANPKAQWIVTTDYTDGWSVSLTIRDADDNIAYSTAGAVASATLVTVEIEAPTGLPMTGCPGQWQGKFDVQLSKAGSVKTIALGACYINEDQTR